MTIDQILSFMLGGESVRDEDWTDEHELKEVTSSIQSAQQWMTRMVDGVTDDQIKNLMVELALNDEAPARLKDDPRAIAAHNKFRNKATIQALLFELLRRVRERLSKAETK